MKTKKLLTHLLVLSMIFPSTLSHFTLQAEAKDDSQVEFVEFDDSYVRDDETGYISLPIDNDPYPETESVMKSSTYSSLPSSYHNYSYVKSAYPATRNQNPYGTCWAFASVACAEFDLITEGTFANGEVTDFSELQLAYNMYHSGNDLLGNLSGDGISLNSKTDYLNFGSNVYYAQFVLANWRGLTHEDNIPYKNAASVLQNGVPSGQNWNTWNNMVRLENSRILDIKSDPNSVKQAIIDHGAVAASYMHDSSYYNTANGHALYYCPYAKTANHAIAIVGWDDTFPASRWSGCSYKPSKNGAWLIRNSWTTTTGSSEKSYFWMSYEDASLASAAYMLDFATGNNVRVSDYHYDTIYQYDGCVTHSGITTKKIANVFTARNPYNANSEALNAVMIPFSYDYGTTLMVEVYTGLTDSSNPESGQLHSEATAYYMTDYKGIHTIRLAVPVILAPGETYSIVVTSLSNSAIFDVETSGKIFNNEVTTTASAKKGQSFYSNGSTWYDFYERYGTSYGNICLKGFTKNSSIKKYTIKYNLNGGTKVGTYPSEYTSESKSFTLPTPERSGYHFVGWYTDSTMTQKISSVSGSTAKNLVLYAKWEAHNYQEQVTPATLKNDGIVKQICQTCGAAASTSTVYMPQKLTLSYTKTSYTGSAKKPSVTVTDRNGNTISSSYYKVSYKNNTNIGTATVTVTFQGIYSGTMSSTFKIEKKGFTKVSLSYSSHTYTGKYLKPTVSVYNGSTKLSSKYYSVSYKNNKNVGTATVTVTGKGKYANYVTKKTFKINPKKFTKVTTKYSSYGYTGKSIKPSVSVYSGKTKLSSKYYSVSYKNNKNIGTATITVTGKGKYANYKSTKTFKVIPKKQVILELSTRNQIGYIYCTHTYDAQANGYHVQVSTSKSFSQYSEANVTSDSWYIYNLTSNKTYYVRVRSYKYVNGQKYYGSWSTVKSKKSL